MQRLDLLHCQFVVAAHNNLRAQLAQVLDKVVRKRIVVVENEDHGPSSVFNPSVARERPPPLLIAAPRCHSATPACCIPPAHLQNWLWSKTMVLHFLIQGRVQGVGFRWFVHREASELDLRGWVRNTEDGEVEVVASGNEADLAELRASLRRGPRGSRVDHLIEHHLDEREAEGLGSFRIDGAW